MRTRALMVMMALLLVGCAPKSSHPTMWWPKDPTAKVRNYRMGTSSRADDLIKWSLIYADRMNLQSPDIIFQPLGGKWCGLALPPTRPGQVLVAYDLSDWCAVSWSARDTALHEMCHHRYAHTIGTRSESLDDKAKHKEVDACVKAYRKVGGR